MNPVPREDDSSRGFASDNFAGAHPRILEALAAVNGGHAMAYGEDPVTARARAAFNRLFGREVDTHFVFNGTGANVTALLSMLPRWGAVVCAQTAHINVDEGGAPEKVA